MPAGSAAGNGVVPGGPGLPVGTVASAQVLVGPECVITRSREPDLTREYRSMPAHLLSLTDGPSILIDKPILLFGRHEECDVQLNSKKVSRRHCVLAQVGDYLVIRDL